MINFIFHYILVKRGNDMYFRRNSFFRLDSLGMFQSVGILFNLGIASLIKFGNSLGIDVDGLGNNLFLIPFISNVNNTFGIDLSALFVNVFNSPFKWLAISLIVSIIMSFLGRLIRFIFTLVIVIFGLLVVYFYLKSLGII